MGKYIVTLDKEEQEKLKEVIAKRSSKSEIVKRAFVLLNLDENGADQKKSDEQIRLDYKVGQRTIERLRKRFVEDGFETALKGKPQMKFRERKIDGRVARQTDCAALFGRVCGQSKMEFALFGGNLDCRWRNRIYLARIGQTDAKKNELKPWQVKEWIIPSADAYSSVCDGRSSGCV